jgi:hypothetical protein
VTALSCGPDPGFWNLPEVRLLPDLNVKLQHKSNACQRGRGRLLPDLQEPNLSRHGLRVIGESEDSAMQPMLHQSCSGLWSSSIAVRKARHGDRNGAAPAERSLPCSRTRHVAVDKCAQWPDFQGEVPWLHADNQGSYHIHLLNVAIPLVAPALVLHFQSSNTT